MEGSQPTDTGTESEDLMCMRHDPLWTAQDVATYLGVTVQTLYDWRLRGSGPPVMKVGRHLRYRESDVMAWLDKKTSAA
jgi:excisionase family DNA binding protein